MMAYAASNTARYVDAASTSGLRNAEYHNLLQAKGDALFRRLPLPEDPSIYYAIEVLARGWMTLAAGILAYMLTRCKKISAANSSAYDFIMLRNLCSQAASFMNSFYCIYLFKKRSIRENEQIPTEMSVGGQYFY
jgi:hypothetical protein